MRSKFGWLWREILLKGTIASISLVSCVSGKIAIATTPNTLPATLETKIQPSAKSLSSSNFVEQKINTGNQGSNTIILQVQRPDPNSDRFPQPAPIPSPLPQPDSPVQTPTPQPTPQPTPAPSSPTIEVQKIEVSDSTVFSDRDFQPLVSPVEGKTVTIEELRIVADKITQLYLDRGYITSRAILEDPVTSGVVKIRIIEGSVERIDIEGTQKLRTDYIRSRIQLGAQKPLNTGKLEEQLRLLRLDPLFRNVEGSLRAGSGLGQSILVVRVTEANSFEFGLGADNYSPPTIGSERLGISLGDRNLLGIGDRLAASYYRTTTGGADIFDFSYTVPLNPMNGTLQLRYAPNRNNITLPPFNILNISGQSNLYELSYRQPLVRSIREEFALSLGFTYQDGQTFTFAGPTPFGIGPDENGISRTSVIKFGQDYTLRDVSGAWALRSLFSLGTGLFNATINADPIPDARFFSWLGQIQRVQVLNPDNFLIVTADIQLSNQSLLSSQQFVIGGGQSVRGFRQNVRAGDNGFRFSIEDRITIQRDPGGSTVLQLAPFFDMGSIWNVSNNPNSLPNQTFLAGAGLGLIWQPVPRLNVRIDYAVPLVNLSDRGRNFQDEGFYFSVNYGL